MLTDGFHGRRRKVPGGAAGLQNRRAVFSIVQQRRRFSDKSAFLFSYRVFSRSVIFFSNCRGRTIFAPKLLQEWQQGMAIRPQVPYVAVMTSPVAISRPPWHLNFGKGCPSSLPGSHKQKFWNFIFSNLCAITRSLLGKRGAGFTLGPSAHQSIPCTALARADRPALYF
jgi:hypothetical protein